MPELATLIEPERVRRALDPTWVEADLPAAAVTDLMFTAPAVSELLLLDSGAAGRTGAEQQAVKVALNYLVAAQLAPVVRFIAKEDYGDGGGYTLQTVDPDSLAAELRKRAMNQIAGFATPAAAGSPGSPPAFIVVN